MLGSRRVLAGIAVAVVVLGLSSIARSSFARAHSADYNCSCVQYVEAMTGLPGGPATAAGYTESEMNTLGYYRIVPPGDGEIPADGAIMVWDADHKGAGPDGHMALVVGNPSYNYSSQKWTIHVQHVDWDRSGTGNPNCGVEADTFTHWGDLDGVNFYRPSGQ